MTYLSDNSSKKKSKRIRYGISFLVIVVLVVFWPFFKKTLYQVTEPFFGSYYTTSHSFSFIPSFVHTYVGSRKKLAEENIALQQKVELLENALAEKEAYYKEHGTEVSSTSSLHGETISPIVVMYPLMQDITSLYSTIILSKGFKDGVTVGATVFIRGRQAVCTVKEVSSLSSVCQLLTASGVVTEGVTSSSTVTLTLYGRGGHFLANIPRDTPVTVGEKVYLRSDQGMVLGSIKQILDNNQDTSWHVFVEGAYNPITSSLFYVQP